MKKPGHRSSKHRRETLAQFDRAVTGYKARPYVGAGNGLAGLRNSLVIAVRHFTHPGDYALACEFMRRAAVACGDTVDARGVWAPCAGEVWLKEALETEQVPGV